MEVINDSYVKKENLKPVFKAITDESGRFEGVINMPTAVDSIYLYTNYFGVPNCIPLKVKDNIDFDLNNNIKNINNRAKTRAFQTGVLPDGMLTLGYWDTETGYPDYLLPERAQVKKGLINDIMYTLPESKYVHPEFIEEGSVTNITLKEKCKVNMIFLHEGASKKNVVGYFHYPVGKKPQSISEVKRILAFPNLSFGNSGGGALSSGDQVELKYWNEEKQQFEEEFPENTVIGWFIIAAGFRGTQVSDNNFVFYSIPELNTNEEPGYRQHNVALYDENRKIVAIGFEDTWRTPGRNGSGDNDFNDAVFYVSTTPSTAIDGGNMNPIIPDPTPGPSETDNYIDYEGTLAFEDLWPNKGDFDMNDAVIGYKSRHYRNKNNQVIKIEDTFTPLWAGAIIHSGFGYQLGIRKDYVKTLEIESDASLPPLFTTDAKGLEFSQTLATIMLFDNLHNVKGNVYKITMELSSPQKESSILFPPYNPFIVIGSGDGKGRGKELHLPNMKPTQLVDPSYFGTEDDRSIPILDTYYVSELNYPFAIHIPTVFDFPKEEKVAIDKLYPMFTEWATSHGEKNKDWYLHKK